MTMDFKRPPSAIPSNINPGVLVRFAFTMGADGQPLLTHIDPVAGAGAMEMKQ